MTSLLSVLLLIFSGTVFAGGSPVSISGRVVDAESGEPLAFVNIMYGESRLGAMTDIDGYFRITSHETESFLRLSYVGYEPKVFTLPDEAGVLSISMVRKPIELTEVVVLPGENPANRIIDLVMANRDLNNPEKMGSFTYESYNKFTFTGELEARGDEDSGDTLTSRINRFIGQRHFFLMETVAERKFSYPDRSNETILASRISGVENPIFAILMTQMQSFSFYDDYIQIFDNQYLSPLARGGTNRYFFHLEDTTYVGRDTVFVISYRPGRGRNFEGLSGVMYINTNGWALQSVIAGPASDFGNTRIRIQQQYEHVQGRQWFPVQLNTDFEIIDLNDISGFKVVGEGRTYLKNIRLDPPLTRRDFSPFHLSYSPETIVDDETFWEKYRAEQLSPKDTNTYHYLDSIGRELDLDGQIARVEALLSGYWRRGVFNVAISSLLRYNAHEGFRPGVSFVTNDRLSPGFDLRGGIAYGFRDQTLKYEAGGSILIDRLTDLRLGYHYLYDVTERGGSKFLGDGGFLSTQNLRLFYLRHMDLIESHSLWLNMRIFRNYLTIRPYVALERINHTDGYRFIQPAMETLPGDEQTADAKYFETGIRLRLAWGERFIQTPDRILSMGDLVPEIQLNIARGLHGLMDGDFDYWRIETMLYRKFRIPMLGAQHWRVRAGLFVGEAPLDKRFHPPAAFSQFALSTPASFATMRPGEFFSDRYIALFWYHHFENLLYKGGRFNPQFLLLTNIITGTLGDRENHEHEGFRTLESAYFESGIAVLDLIGSGFSSMGLECMMRYGPHGLPKWKDNLSVRLSYRFLF